MMEALGYVLLALIGLGLAGLALLAAGLVWQRIDQYRWRTRFDVRRDADLPRSDRVVRTQALSLGPEGLQLPTIDQPFGSAFLELRVRATAAGLLADPWIELEGEGARVRQYVERGARGRRLVNATALLRANGAAPRWRLRTGLLQVDGTEAVLHLLAPSTVADPDARTLVIAPHPDDAELAAWSLVSRRQTWVVTVTQGDAGPNAYGTHFDDPVESYRTKAGIRVWDSLNVVRMAGVPLDRIANLGYFDGTLAAMQRGGGPVQAEFLQESDPGVRRHNPIAPQRTPAEATWQGLVDDIAALLREVRPQRIAVPHPQLDPHPDHRCSTLATLQALQQVGLREGELWLYTNHLGYTKTHPVGPNDGEIGLPHGLPEGTLFDSVVSVPMDARTRFLKRLAVEAQHDLQATPPVAMPTLAQRAVGLLRTLYRSTVVADIGFIRRAPRPNELFYVLAYDRAGELAARIDLQDSDAGAA